MVDGERRGRGLKMAERGERHLLSAHRLHINVGEIAGVILELRPDLKHHVILVQLREDGGDLALAKGVIQRVIDGLRQDAEACRGIAVDDEVGLQSAILLVTGHVTQFGE